MTNKASFSEALPIWMKDHLPEYESLHAIPKAFDDSTHQLWRLNSSSVDQSNHFLKICSNSESPFWQVMSDLFDCDLRRSINYFSEIYALIDSLTSLAVPELIKAETLENNESYILTAAIDGTAVTAIDKDQSIKQLAKHLAELHSKQRDNWGALNGKGFKALDWPKRLEATLLKCSEKWGGVYSQSTIDSKQGYLSVKDNDSSKAKEYLKQALNACNLIEATEFVLMMPDLRWDQFMQIDNKITALVDLDAFVFAPRELDFVILEYLLSVDQIKVFIDTYSKHHDIPEIKNVRTPYRLLLFYMEILGESNIDVWMNKEASL